MSRSKTDSVQVVDAGNRAIALLGFPFKVSADDSGGYVVQSTENPARKVEGIPAGRIAGLSLAARMAVMVKADEGDEDSVALLATLDREDDCAAAARSLKIKPSDLAAALAFLAAQKSASV